MTAPAAAEGLSALPATIATPRLLLRRPTLDDAQAVFDRWASDPDTARYLTWVPATDVAETVAFLRTVVTAWHGTQRRVWHLTLHGDDTPIGALDAGLDAHGVELGYVLGRAWWGQRLMPEAVGALAPMLLALPQVHRVSAYCDVENVASAKVMERVGMLREGLLRKYTVHPNVGPEPRDCYLYAVVR